MVNIDNWLLGIACSVIASIMVIIAELIIKLNSRQKINLMVNYIQDCYWQLENALNFNDYNIVTTQADNVLQTIISIYQETNLFTFSSKKRKLFYTYLYNVYYYMYTVKTTTIGYPMETEYQCRCERLKSYLDNDTNCAHEDWLGHSITLLELLSNYCGIKKAITKFHKRHPNVELKILINARCFGKGYTKNQLRLHLMKQKEYYKCIDKYIK